MTEQQHRATPEQWAQIERFVEDCGYDACLLELRDRIADLEDDATEHSKSAHFCFEAIIGRIEALEAAANSSAGLTGSNHPAIPDSSPAPARGLVERVAEIISNDDDGHHWSDEARAAILVVADWLDAQEPVSVGFPSAWLREEV